MSSSVLYILTIATENIHSATTTAELTWLQSLFRELGFFLPRPTVLWCDNIGATYLTTNPAFHARTKHIEIDFHFVRDRVATRCLDVRYCSTKDQVADIFTKPLISHCFELLRDKLNVHSTPFRLPGPIGTIGEDNDQNSNEPYQDNKLHHNER